MNTNELAVVYKEDVQRALGCSAHTALVVMKRTGKAFKVGKRLALHVGVFYSLLLNNDDVRV